MSLTDKIIENVRSLPESKQMEILDFVEYLRAKIEKEEREEWMNLSLTSAMRGMEEEELTYSMNDLKETYS
ncbi:MAG: DUF2281 domain-containing protein [Deltaproteobacteria bacterium]|jgi:hypothetical protein|nr:DUF2281 domain-containing protein [Deltaproteobacteria bacterium]